MTGGRVAVNITVVVDYAASEANLTTKLKEDIWKTLGHIVGQVPTKVCLLVLVNANAWADRSMEGCGNGRVLGSYGRDNSNGKRRYWYSLQTTNSLSQTRFSALSRVEYLIRLTA